jgi:hypothetical protein
MASSHPYLSDAVVFLVDAPQAVEWKHIVSAFELCGVVRNGGRVVGTSGAWSWTVECDSLRGGACHSISIPLSRTDAYLLNSGDGNCHPQRSLPIFVPSVSSGSKLSPFLRAQVRYAEFSIFGPLVSVRTRVHIHQDDEVGDVIQFWDLASALAAVKYVREVREERAIIFNPFTLECSVRSPHASSLSRT